jgi:hypothetical protein
MPCLEINRIYPNLIDSVGKKGFVPIKCRPVGVGSAGDARAPQYMAVNHFENAQFETAQYEMLYMLQSLSNT